MSEVSTQRPVHDWTSLEQLVGAGDVEGVLALLRVMTPSDLARAISRLSSESQRALLTLLDPPEAADLVSEVSEVQAVELLESLEPVEAAAIVDELPSDQQADLLGELPDDDSAAILDEMAPAEAEDARALLAFDPDTAGGLMVREFLVYPEHRVVADVVADLREHGDEYSDYDVQYIYVSDAEGRIAGVLRMRDLLLASRQRQLLELMITEPRRVRAADGLDVLRDFFDDHAFLGVPVVDDGDRLVGVLHRRSVQEAEEDRTDRAYLESSGIVGGEELRTMPLLLRSRRRLSWLSVNILLNIAAASVIAAYQDTLSAVIALAVFLPIISDMSGCSGNQAAAVSNRELMLGIVRPTEVLRVVGQELTVGLINGVALGGLLAAAAYLWQGNPYLGLVAGVALAANTLVAVMIGGAVPLLLRGLGKDPALASGPILTTVTDMCGFFLVLSLASSLLPHLT